MGKYNIIKSKFVREKIKNASYKKSSDYIEDLMKIEHYVLGGSFGMCTGYLINSLQKQYPKEWKAIWDELKPGKLQEIKRKEILERQKEKEEEAEDRKQEKIDEEKNKANWIKLGGKI